MSSINDLDTLSLRKLFYLLSIDLWSALRKNPSGNESDNKILAERLCQDAFDNFGIELDVDEVYILFIQPLAKYLKPLTSDRVTRVSGQYALSIHHLEYNSSFEYYLKPSAK